MDRHERRHFLDSSGGADSSRHEAGNLPQANFGPIALVAAVVKGQVSVRTRPANGLLGEFSQVVEDSYFPCRSARMRLRRTPIVSSLSLQRLLHLNAYYSWAYAAAEIGLTIYKLAYLSLDVKVRYSLPILVAVWCICELARLPLGYTGNLREKVGARVCSQRTLDLPARLPLHTRPLPAARHVCRCRSCPPSGYCRCSRSCPSSCTSRWGRCKSAAFCPSTSPQAFC
jgi:hypothetical protein